MVSGVEWCDKALSLALVAGIHLLTAGTWVCLFLQRAYTCIHTELLTLNFGFTLSATSAYWRVTPQNKDFLEGNPIKAFL